MKLSIIIPIYNTGNYLRKCIDSCLNQDILPSEYEIILVNDGSTDESNFICEEYKEKFANIYYLQQKNSGQSVARNNGFEFAKGEYIWFIDSDDWIKENSLNSILEFCSFNNLDILRIGFNKVDEGSFPEYSKKDILLRNTCLTKSGKEFLKNDFVFGAPLYIFKRSYLKDKNLSFYPKIYHEDNEFTPRALYFANRIGTTKIKLYNYLTRSGSTTLSVNPKKCFDLMIVCQSLMSFSLEVDKNTKPYINNVISTSFNSVLAHAKHLDSSSKSELKKQVAANKNIFANMRRSKEVKYKIEGILFSIFPNHVFELYDHLKK